MVSPKLQITEWVKKKAEHDTTKIVYFVERAHLGQPQKKMCEMGSVHRWGKPHQIYHSILPLKEQLPNGKYLDILLRCLQFLTLCSISFQAWAILYEHISHIAKAVNMFKQPRSCLPNSRKLLEKTLFFRENVRKKYSRKFAKISCLRTVFGKKTFVSNVADKFSLFFEETEGKVNFS